MDYDFLIKIGKDIAPILTSLGILVAVWQLKANHDRSRREFASRLIWEWTSNVRRNTKVTTKLIDKLGQPECEHIFNQDSFKLDNEFEPLLKAALSGTGLTFEVTNDKIIIDESVSSFLRGLVTSYLNLLESVFVAWHHRVADRKIIEQQFRYLVNPDGKKIFLEQYITVAGSTRNYPAICEFIAYLENNYWPNGSLRNRAG